MYRIESQRKKWGVWGHWRPWKGGVLRYTTEADAAPFLDLLTRVWPQHRFRIKEMPDEYQPARPVDTGAARSL